MIPVRNPDQKDLLLDQQMALTHYLDDLLCEPPTSEARAAANPAQQVAVALVAEVVPLVPEPEKIDPASEGVGASQPEVVAVKNLPLDCMFFKLAGLVLAVPMEQLTGVEKLAQALQNPALELRLVEQDMYGVPCSIIDITKVLLPPARIASLGDLSKRHFRQIILVDNNRLGLVCEEILGVISVAPSAIRWRTDTGKRPWMAGMISDQQAVLLNLPGLQGVLQESS